jgi:signal transduction histidine kinase
VAWLAGENLRARRARWAELEERARRLEREREERDRRAVAAERLRIARELHDVVAHAMTVVAVQAGVANHLLDERPELARPALSTVETTARSALVEMRRLLGVLREADDPAGTMPTPGLGDLPTLVAQFERAGLEVRLRLDGAPADLPEGVDVSAYRIVQEGLTNVMRHGGLAADVEVTCRDSGAVIEIRDDGRPPTARSGEGGGHGLIGIRERVAVFGGEFLARREGAGFHLRATLPAGSAS